MKHSRRRQVFVPFRQGLAPGQQITPRPTLAGRGSYAADGLHPPSSGTGRTLFSLIGERVYAGETKTVRRQAYARPDVRSRFQPAYRAFSPMARASGSHWLVPSFPRQRHGWGSAIRQGLYFTGEMRRVIHAAPATARTFKISGSLKAHAVTGPPPDAQRHRRRPLPLCLCPRYPAQACAAPRIEERLGCAPAK